MPKRLSFEHINLRLIILNSNWLNKMKITEIKSKNIFGGDGIHNPNEINPYVGCMFHCTYCYVEGNRNPKHDLLVKVNAPELVRRDISQLDPGIPIFLSSQTDPYLYAEKKYQITRKCIDEIRRHPKYHLSILTKSDLVLRDIDLFRKLNCKVQFSISLIDEKFRKVIEPFAPPVSKRIRAIIELERNQVPTSVRIKPVLPFGFSDVKEIVETVEGLTSGKIIIQGIGLRYPYVVRMAQIAQEQFPEHYWRWIQDFNVVRENQIDLVGYLKNHDRVDYREIDEVIEEVEARFNL